MTLTWRFELDLNRNNLWEFDITAYVQSAEWSLGLTTPFATMANDAKATIKVTNTNGEFNPEDVTASNPFVVDGANLLRPHRRLRVVAIRGGIDEVMWIGWIKRITPIYNSDGAYTGKTTATLICEGIKARLETVTLPFSVYEDVTGDEIVEDALRLAVIPPAVPGGWLAGVPGYSEAGVTTYAGANNGFIDLDTGTTTFPLLGDKELTGWQAIKQVTDGERGFFYQARNGKAVWRNRHSRLLNLTSQATISDTANKAVKIGYEWDVDVINNLVRVTVNPRKVGSSATLYELQTSVAIPPGAIITMEAPYRDADGQAVGISSISNSPTFTGATPTISVTDLGNRAKVTIDNSANSAGATLTTLTITGEPIQDRNPIIGVAMDTESVGIYGKQELSLNIPALSTLQQAQSIANFELLRRKDPRPSVDKLMFLRAGNDSDNALQLNLTMEDRITINLPSKNHNTDHFIIGEAHEWKAGSDSPVHETTFFLEPASPYQFWLAGVAGYSEAGVTTRGAY